MELLFPSFFQAGQTSTKTTRRFAPLQSLRQHCVYQSQEDGECGAHGVPSLVSQQEFSFYPFSVLRQPHVDPGVFGAAAAHPKAGDANEVVLVSVRVVTHQGAPAVTLQIKHHKKPAACQGCLPGNNSSSKQAIFFFF